METSAERLETGLSDNSVIESATREHVFTDFVDSRWRQADTEAKTFEVERIKQLQGEYLFLMQQLTFTLGQELFR